MLYHLKSLLLLLSLLTYSFLQSQSIISNITPNTNTIGRYEKFEITFNVNTSYSNPYDPDIVDITVHFQSPTLTNYQIPAFWYQAYSPVTGSFENYTPIGSPQWIARFAPLENGQHSYFIVISDANGTSTSATNWFTVLPSSSEGFLRRNPSNEKYLRFDNGHPYIPLGHNVAWDDHSGTRFFNNYYSKMNQNGETWTRFWMAAFNRLTLEWSSTHWSGNYQGLGKYAQIPSWRVDYALEKAKEKEIYVQLVLLHHGMFSSSVNAQWSENPYNVALGGFLSTPDEFFTNETAKDLYKKQLRYIVARYGYNSHILAWELWNEVQFTDNFGSSTVQQNNVTDWHQEMAEYIRQIDPYQHLITTSSEGNGFQNIWAIPEIDIIQIHYYGAGREEFIHNYSTTLRSYNKPVWVGEYGSADYTTNETQDTAGIYLHNGIWAGALSESVAASWWWDNAIEPFNLYTHFLPLSNFIGGEDWAELNLSNADFQISGGTQDTTGLQLYPGLGWDSSRQREFTVQSDGTAPGIEYLSAYIQGIWHTEMGREAVFHVTTQSNGQFGVYISNFSPFGAPILQIFVDNSTIPVYNQTVSTTGLVTVSLSSGSHWIRVYNNGFDWFVADYFQFSGFILPAAQGYGLANDRKAFIWIRDRKHEYNQINNGTISDSQLQINNLVNGTYTISFYNTYTGDWTDTTTYNVTNNSMNIIIPDFQRDMALKLYLGTADTELFPE